MAVRRGALVVRAGHAFASPVALPGGRCACGVSRLSLYRMLWTGRVSDDLAALLTPLVRRFAGKLRFRHTSPRSDEPSPWEIIET
jgi:hypothetical protein